MNRPEPKYSIGEKVEVQGWVGSDMGTIVGIDWIYHNRFNEYRWGYKIDFDGEGVGMTFIFIPEGYLCKLDQLKGNTK